MNALVRATSKISATSLWFILSILLLLVVAVLDHKTGPRLSFSLFYLVPIAVASWGSKSNYGILMALLSMMIWLYIEVLTHPEEGNFFVHAWNGITRLGFFLLPAFFLKSLQRERLHSRTDFLTGASNHRHFHEGLQMEIDRSARYSLHFTVAFIDVDNFKVVNDTFGHIFGDEILKAIVDTMRNTLRKTDLVARVGGDEFAILLPETNEKAARTAITNMCQKLTDEMRTRKCPITFSVGALTLNAPRISSDKILSIADRMMYLVKNSGKDNIRFETHQPPEDIPSKQQSAPPTPPRS